MYNHPHVYILIYRASSILIFFHRFFSCWFCEQYIYDSFLKKTNKPTYINVFLTCCILFSTSLTFIAFVFVFFCHFISAYEEEKKQPYLSNHKRKSKQTEAKYFPILNVPRSWYTNKWVKKDIFGNSFKRDINITRPKCTTKKTLRHDIQNEM